MATREQVEAVLSEKIAPRLRADGGDIELVDVGADNVVKVRLRGACAGCPGARMTLRMGVERILKQDLPDIVSVEAV
ncbi:MAG TPA: NifU family protein [Candidatus Brocadiia bacterium]|nr:NifU family protein [Candidatus Brocadiia bacterium]